MRHTFLLLSLFISGLAIGFFILSSDSESNPSSSMEESNGASSNLDEFEPGANGTEEESAQFDSFLESEVATHNSIEDCWVIINSNVYNVTGILEEYEDDPSTIIEVCGSNGTEVFTTDPVSSQVSGLIPAAFVGRFSN